MISRVPPEAQLAVAAHVPGERLDRARRDGVLPRERDVELVDRRRGIVERADERVPLGVPPEELPCMHMRDPKSVHAQTAPTSAWADAKSKSPSRGSARAHGTETTMWPMPTASVMV